MEFMKLSGDTDVCGREDFKAASLNLEVDTRKSKSQTKLHVPLLNTSVFGSTVNNCTGIPRVTQDPGPPVSCDLLCD